MTSLAQRLVVLAALALLAGLAAVAIVERRHQPARAAGPEAAVAPGGGWYTALAGSRGPAGDAERTTCGLILTGRSLGVTHPTLPCRAKLFIRYGDHTVLTEVIDNRLKSRGRQLELTDSLARMIGIDGTQRLRWRFAIVDSR